MQNSVNSGALVGSWVSITLQNFHPRLKIRIKKKVTTQIQITHRSMTVNVSKLQSCIWYERKSFEEPFSPEYLSFPSTTSK